MYSVGTWPYTKNCRKRPCDNAESKFGMVELQLGGVMTLEKFKNQASKKKKIVWFLYIVR